ncbi:MAG: hypothetical protein AB7P34_22595, partial [Vicinamibacterales bacterium]
HPAPKDLLHLPRGAYDCFTVDTLVDCGTAGEREVGLRELQALYETGEVEPRDGLSGFSALARPARAGLGNLIRWTGLQACRFGNARRGSGACQREGLGLPARASGSPSNCQVRHNQPLNNPGLNALEYVRTTAVAA